MTKTYLQRRIASQVREMPVGKRILVVDDERVVTEVVERYLTREGLEVSLAYDGSEALRRAREWTPDLVILDLMLPKVDGVEVCRRLARTPMLPSSCLLPKVKRVIVLLA